MNSQSVTFVITHYGDYRKEALAELLESLKRHYPDIAVRLQETGGNLSRARNIAFEQVGTKWAFLLEEDMLLDDDTSELLIDGGIIASLLDVAHDCRDLAIIAPAFTQESKTRGFCHDMIKFRGTVTCRKPVEDAVVTNSGIVYQPCDLVPNCGLFNTAVCRDLRWDEDLELQEHRDFFWRLKQAQTWRVAYVPRVKIHHRQVDEPDDYMRMRSRSFHKLVEKKHDCKFRMTDQYSQGNPTHSPCNIIILTPGHTGSSIAAKMLYFAGWNLSRDDSDDDHKSQRLEQLRDFDVCPMPLGRKERVLTQEERDERYAQWDHELRESQVTGLELPQDVDWLFYEHTGLRNVHDEYKAKINRNGKPRVGEIPFNYVKAKYLIESLPEPWVIKFPRFRDSSENWMELLKQYEPILLYLTRDRDGIYESYVKRLEVRGMAGDEAHGYMSTVNVDKRIESCDDVYKMWPWKKIQLDINDLGSAAALWDANRMGVSDDIKEDSK